MKVRRHKTHYVSSKRNKFKKCSRHIKIKRHINSRWRVREEGEEVIRQPEKKAEYLNEADLDWQRFHVNNRGENVLVSHLTI